MIKIRRKAFSSNLISSLLLKTKPELSWSLNELYYTINVPFLCTHYEDMCLIVAGVMEWMIWVTRADRTGGVSRSSLPHLLTTRWKSYSTSVIWQVSNVRFTQFICYCSTTFFWKQFLHVRGGRDRKICEDKKREGSLWTAHSGQIFLVDQ